MASDGRTVSAGDGGSRNPASSLIFVADDYPDNLNLVVRQLLKAGYRVEGFEDGQTLLDAVNLEWPDLFLLDVHMPRLSGLDLCRRLTKLKPDSTSPVVLISANGEPATIVEGFRVGAVDYVTKPFRFSELEARVRTQLELKAAREQLARRNEWLEAEVRRRTKQLELLNGRLRVLDEAKGGFLAMFSHEFRTPLDGVLRVADWFSRIAPDGPESRSNRSFLREHTRRLKAILEEAELLSQLGPEASPDEAVMPMSLMGLVEAAFEPVQSFVDSLGLEVKIGCLGGGDNCSVVQTRGSVYLLIQGFTKILESSFRLADSDGAIRVEVGQEADEGLVRWSVRGKPLSQAECDRFFEIFATTQYFHSGREIVLGLAPPLADRIFRLHGGRISVSGTRDGARFEVRLPTCLA